MPRCLATSPTTSRPTAKAATRNPTGHGMNQTPIAVASVTTPSAIRYRSVNGLGGRTVPFWAMHRARGPTTWARNSSGSTLAKSTCWATKPLVIDPPDTEAIEATSAF